MKTHWCVCDHELLLLVVMIDRSNYFSGRKEIYKRGELQMPMLKLSKVSKKNRRKYYEKKRIEIKETFGGRVLWGKYKC